jgi:DHA2 family multidrug resistance protein-like MFS transporter
VAQTGNELGYALGIAALGSIGTAVYRTQLADTIPTGTLAQAAQAARESLAGATAAAGQLPDQLAAVLLAVAREAFTSGLHAVAAVAAVVAAGVAILILTTLRDLPPIGQAQPAQPDQAQAAAPATAADPDHQHDPVSAQPRPRTPPASPRDGA